MANWLCSTETNRNSLCCCFFFKLKEMYYFFVVVDIWVFIVLSECHHSNVQRLIKYRARSASFRVHKTPDSGEMSTTRGNTLPSQSSLNLSASRQYSQQSSGFPEHTRLNQSDERLTSHAGSHWKHWNTRMAWCVFGIKNVLEGMTGRKPFSMGWLNRSNEIMNYCRVRIGFNQFIKQSLWGRNLPWGEQVPLPMG